MDNFFIMLSKMFNFFGTNNSNFLISCFNPIQFSKNVIFKDCRVFYSSYLKDELLDPVLKKKEVFSIYTRVCKSSDLLLFQSFDVVFDIYSINCGFLGREYMKTISFCAKHDEMSREVIFRVLNGEGFFLLENTLDRREVKFIKVKKGDFVLIPKDWAFIMINSSTSQNFVASCLRDKSVRIKKDLFRDVNGAFLFYTKTGFIKNKNVGPYYNLQEYFGDYLEDYIFEKELGLYGEFIKFPEKFNFLKE